MTTTEKARRDLERKHAGVQGITEKLVILRDEQRTSIATAGKAALNGDRTDRERREIGDREAELKILEAAESEGRIQVAHLEQELQSAIEKDSLDRMGELRRELDTTAVRFEELLRKSLGDAENLERLFSEAYTLSTSTGTALASLGSWASAVNPPSIYASTRLREILAAITGTRG